MNITQRTIALRTCLHAMGLQDWEAESRQVNGGYIVTVSYRGHKLCATKCPTFPQAFARALDDALTEFARHSHD